MTPAKDKNALSHDVIQAFDKLNGSHPGYRPAHAKGILLSGVFTPSPGGTALTRAPHLQRASTPVSVRFSDFAGVPNIPDNDPNASPRGIGIRFHLAEHTHTDIVAHSVDGFPARTAEEFVEFLRAAGSTGPDTPHPTPIEMFLGTHPAALEFVQVPKPIPASYASESYFSVSAHQFIDQSGTAHFGRYRVRPDGPSQYLAPDVAASKPANFLIDEIQERVAKGPVSMRIFVQIAAPGDVVDDSTVHWPEDRPQVDFGSVQLTGVVPANEAEQRHIIFDPIARVDGIAVSGDPLLEPRADVYLASGRRRRTGSGAIAMRVVRLAGFARGPVLVEAEAPNPQPGPGEVLVRVYAAGVTPTELIWYPTTHTKSGEKRVDAIPGHEFSGCVVAVGPGVDPLEIGHGVFGMNDWFGDGATAEYCLAPLTSVARKPRRLPHVDAASIPIGALTAWQGLLDRAKLQAGETVLVHGGSGAVGVFAVQLARLHGAHVIATASTGNLEFVKNLGAESVIDYRQSRFEEIVHDVDVVFDTVGGETLDRSWGVLKPGGRMVTVAASDEPRNDPKVKDAFFIVEPNRQQLTEIAGLVEAGRLRTVLDSVVPLEKAEEAYTGRVERRGRGKLVIAIEVPEC